MPDRSGTEPLPRHLLIALGVLWLLMFTVRSQFIAILPLLPAIGQETGASTASLGWLVSGYALAIGVTTLFWGPVSDRIGRRKILIIGSSSVAVALMLHGFVHSYAGFLIARVVTGMVAGMCTSGILAYMGDAFPSSRRGWAMGVVISGFAFGQVAGLPLATWMADIHGYRTPFVAFGGLMALCAVGIWLFVPQPENVVPRRRPLPELMADYPHILASRELGTAMVVGILILSGMSVYITYLPIWMHDVLHMTPQQTAWTFSLAAVAILVAAPRAGRLSDRIGRRWVIAGGTAAVGVLVLLTPVAGLFPYGVTILYFVMMGFGSSRASSFRTLQTELVPDVFRGQYLSLGNAFEQLGFGVGSALAGLLYANFGFFANCASVSIFSAIVVVFVFLRLPETRNASA